MSTPPQLEALKNRTLDVGFVRLPVQSGEISSLPLFSDHLVIAVGPQEDKENVNRGLRAFAERPFGESLRVGQSPRPIMRICHAAGFLPRVVQEVAEPFTVPNFVRAGAAIALVPNSCEGHECPSRALLADACPRSRLEHWCSVSPFLRR